MNHCDTGGWVVDARPLSADPSDFDADGLPKLGCNHIRCSQCGQIVRSVAGLRPRGMGPADLKAFTKELPALYAAADLASSPRLEPAKASRFYLCHCLYHREDRMHPLTEKDSEWAIGVTDVWRCDGHPVVQLPHDFDGVTVTAEGLDELVGKALSGWLPPRARDADKPRALWLARLHARLTGTKHADEVARAVAGTGGERALQFFEARPGARSLR